MNDLGEDGISDPTCDGNAISGHLGPICTLFLLPFFIGFLCAVVSAQTAPRGDEFNGGAGSPPIPCAEISTSAEGGRGSGEAEGYGTGRTTGASARRSRLPRIPDGYPRSRP